MTTRSHPLTPCLLAAGCALALGARAASPPAPGNAPSLAPIVPKSVFAYQPADGKDPFFPETTRWKKAAPSAPGQPAASRGFLDLLSLKGISITSSRRLALINSVTFAPGEKAALRVNSLSNVIECVEIRDRSVVVCLPDTRETRELFLKENI